MLKGAAKGKQLPLQAQIHALDKAIQKWGDNSNPAAKKFMTATNRALAKKQALQDVRTAIADIKQAMTDLADQAAGKFRDALESSISTTHDAATAAIANSPQAQELAQLTAAQTT